MTEPQATLLARGQLLWRRGEPASTIVFVEAGALGVRAGGGALIGVGPRGSVMGEASIVALLEPAGAIPERRADVFALEDGTHVTEYPPEFVRSAFGVGLHRKVLRTLLAQVCLNATAAAAGARGAAAIAMLTSLVSATAACEASVRSVRSWEDFAELLRVLLHVREAASAIRVDVAGAAGDARDPGPRPMPIAAFGSETSELVRRWLQAEAAFGLERAPH